MVRFGLCMISKGQKEKILRQLEEVGGKLWSRQITKCEFYQQEMNDKIYSEYERPNAEAFWIKVGRKKLNLARRPYCIVGEVRNNLDEKKFNELRPTFYAPAYDCDDCKIFSQDLFDLLEKQSFKKTDPWWKCLKGFIKHVYKEHPKRK